MPTPAEIERARRILDARDRADAWTDGIAMHIPSGWWADIEAQADLPTTPEKPE